VLILECSQGCYGRTDGSVTISLRNFVGEGITSQQSFVTQKHCSDQENRDGGHKIFVMVTSTLLLQTPGLVACLWVAVHCL